MKNTGYIILCVISILSCGDPDKNMEKDSVETYKLTVPSGYTNENYIASLLNVYVDSLNNYNKNEKLPQFLFDNNFEKKLQREHWFLNNIISVREEIFNKVNNKVVLDTILNNIYFQDQYKKEKESMYSVFLLATNRRDSLR